MSVRVSKFLLCDRCGYTLGQQKCAAKFGTVERQNIRWQRIVAKNNGWKVRFHGNMDYCKECWASVVKQAKESLR